MVSLAFVSFAIFGQLTTLNRNISLVFPLFFLDFFSLPFRRVTFVFQIRALSRSCVSNGVIMGSTATVNSATSCTVCWASLAT